MKRKKIKFQPEINEVLFDVIDTLRPTMTEDQKGRFNERILKQMERGRPEVLVWIYRSLGLTVNQIQKFDRILADGADAIDLDADDFAGEVQNLVLQRRGEIEGILSSEQLPRLAEMVEQGWDDSRKR
jgi:hypothetical protein